MSGKGSGRGVYQVREGRGGRGGRGGRVGQGRGRASRGYSYSGDTTKHKVLFSAIEINVFD